MKFPVSGAPYLPPPRSVGAVMREVLYALIPGIVAHAWYFGPWIFIQLALAVSSAVALEALLLRLRGQNIMQFLNDYSVIVTAVLLVLCLPPLTPWWVTLTAIFFAIAIAKHAYGGLGHNRFNPAMVGYVVVLLSFPQALTQWLPPQSLHTALGTSPLTFSQGLWAILSGQLTNGLGWDAITQATPLDTLRQGATQNLLITEIRHSPIFGDFGGHGWEWIANWYFVGGLWLLFRRIISWHVPVATLATVIIFTLPFYLMDPDAHPFPLQHVFSGGIMLGAFFIATDPVSGSATPLGKIIFGIGVAMIMLVIRRWSAYPDGIAFAVLCMNLLTPLLDRYTRPRIYGRQS